MMQKFMTAERSEEGEISVFADPVEAKSMPSSNRSSGSDTEHEEETHDLALAQMPSASQEPSMAAYG